MDHAELQLYYNRCRDEALPFGDPCHVDIDGAEGRPRGHSWVERIAKELELSDKPLRPLVTGLRGTGTSTELLRLKERLGRADGAHQLVVSIDGEEVIDLSEEIAVPDILMAIVQATERRVLEAEGKSPSSTSAGGYLQRLWSWSMGSPTPRGDLVVEMKTRPELRRQVRSALAEHVNRFSKEVRQELISLEQRAQEVGYQRIMVIFDSLERLHGTSANWQEELLSAEKIFGRGSRELHLPIHALYTVPPALVHRQTEGIEFLPMITLYHRDGTRHDAGFAVMRAIVDKRIPTAAWEYLFGKDHGRVLGRIIERSGGHTRQMLHMLRSLLISPQLPVSEEDLQRVFGEQSERYQGILTLGDRRWLAELSRTKTIIIDESEGSERVDRALSNDVVFRYANGDVWYDLNPVCADLVLADRGDSIELTPPYSTTSAQRAGINEIEVRGFKSIESVTLKLGRVTVLLGENGCGKSNLLEAIAFASAAVGQRLDHEFLASRGIRMAKAELMHPAFAEGGVRSMCIGVRSEHERPVDFTFREDPSSTLGAWLSTAEFPEHDTGHANGKGVDTALGSYAAELERFLVFSPENSSLRAFQSEGQILPIGVNGEGLFAHLRALQSKGHGDLLGELNRRLELTDWFSGFEIPDNLGPGEHRLDLQDRYLQTDVTLDQRSANEGFLFLLFYFTLLMSPETPPFFAVDNIDASLNPRLCARLMADLVELAKQHDRKIIATTHNPAILDGLDLDDPEQRLMIVSRTSKGATRVRRVSAPREVEGAPALRLSEAFVRGYLGGLPSNF